MVTVEQFESGAVKLIDEEFDSVYSDLCFLNEFPFPRLIAFKGRDTGTLLCPEFDNILED